MKQEDGIKKYAVIARTMPGEGIGYRGCPCRVHDFGVVCGGGKISSRAPDTKTLWKSRRDCQLEV